jgi:hypothetical protein
LAIHFACSGVVLDDEDSSSSNQRHNRANDSPPTITGILPPLKLSISKIY